MTEPRDLAGERPILWGRGSSTNVQKVLWTCYELGLHPDHRPLGGPFGGNNEDWFLALNPNGTVPVWQDGDLVAYESQAIMRHLARNAGQLYGRSAEEALLVDQWLDWFALVFWPPVRMLFLEVWRDKRVKLEDSAAQEAIRHIECFAKLAAARLRQTPYLAGDPFSLADIALAIGLNRMMGLDYGIDLPKSLQGWFARQTERPGFAFATADEPEMAPRSWLTHH